MVIQDPVFFVIRVAQVAYIKMLLDVLHAMKDNSYINPNVLILVLVPYMEIKLPEFVMKSVLKDTMLLILKMENMNALNVMNYVRHVKDLLPQNA